jgi:cytochrome b pre-mRNA-processing protein 3
MDEDRQSRAIAARVRRWLRRFGPDAADRARKEAAREIYHAVVNQARMAAFYRDLGVPDTPEGRFELVGLHVALVVLRLRAEGAPGRALGQDLFELMFADCDESLRQIGIGDLSVGKQIRRLAGNFYARLKALDEAFAATPCGPLRAMLRTNVYHGGAPPSERQLRALVRYLIAAHAAMRGQPGANLFAGRVAFVPPGEPGGDAQSQALQGPAVAPASPNAAREDAWRCRESD